MNVKFIGETIMEIKKLEARPFFEAVLDFLESDKRTLLVRGLFNQDKLTVILQAMREAPNIKNGVFVTGYISEVPRLFNDSLISRDKFKNPRLKTNYKIANTTIHFEKQEQSVEYNFAFNTDLAVFYPVESALFDEKRTNKVISKLEHSKATKNILITTNDYSNRAEKLYPFVDEVLILDTSSIDKKHTEKAKIIESNLKTEGREMPY